VPRAKAMFQIRKKIWTEMAMNVGNILNINFKKIPLQNVSYWTSFRQHRGAPHVEVMYVCLQSVLHVRLRPYSTAKTNGNILSLNLAQSVLNKNNAVNTGFSRNNTLHLKVKID
jgi:hypothetical protein